MNLRMPTALLRQPKGHTVFRKKRPAPATITRHTTTSVSINAADPTLGHLTLQDLRRLVTETRDWPGTSRVETSYKAIRTTRTDTP